MRSTPRLASLGVPWSRGLEDDVSLPVARPTRLTFDVSVTATRPTRDGPGGALVRRLLLTGAHDYLPCFGLYVDPTVTLTPESWSCLPRLLVSVLSFFCSVLTSAAFFSCFGLFPNMSTTMIPSLARRPAVRRLRPCLYSHCTERSRSSRPASSLLSYPGSNRIHKAASLIDDARWTDRRYLFLVRPLGVLPSRTFSSFFSCAITQYPKCANLAPQYSHLRTVFSSAPDSRTGRSCVLRGPVDPSP